jgi:hypothetical protein
MYGYFVHVVTKAANACQHKGKMLSGQCQSAWVMSDMIRKPWVTSVGTWGPEDGSVNGPCGFAFNVGSTREAGKG